MGYRIGSFNLKNLGQTTLGSKTDRKIDMIARIISEEKFDVVALQEILSEGKAFNSCHPEFAKKTILSLLGNNWDFSWANAGENSHDPRNEGYAFLWNKKRLQMPEITVMGTKRVFKPRICKVNKQDMIRRPFYARFTPVGTEEGGPWVEFRLICVHTYFGDDGSEARGRRQRELDTLMKDIYPQISDRRYGILGNGMPSYTVLMGDYNVQLRREWKELARAGQNASRVKKGLSRIPKPAYLEADDNDIIETTRWGKIRKIKTVQDQFTTLKSDGGGYAHDYDHFSYEESQFEGIQMKVHRVDAVKKYYGSEKGVFEKYGKEVSDHIPIMMEVELRDIETKGE